jgi:hypothetical protein
MTLRQTCDEIARLLGWVKWTPRPSPDLPPTFGFAPKWTRNGQMSETEHPVPATKEAIERLLPKHWSTQVLANDLGVGPIVWSAAALAPRGAYVESWNHATEIEALAAILLAMLRHDANSPESPDSLSCRG